MFASKPPTCTGRTHDLSRKDSDIRYLRHLGNSDIAFRLTHCRAHGSRGLTVDVAVSSYVYNSPNYGLLARPDLRAMLRQSLSQTTVCDTDPRSEYRRRYDELAFFASSSSTGTTYLGRLAPRG